MRCVHVVQPTTLASLLDAISREDRSFLRLDCSTILGELDSLKNMVPLFPVSLVPPLSGFEGDKN